MFDRLKAQLNGFVDKIAKTELHGKSLDEALEAFKLSLVENDVALPVAEHICERLREKAKGLSVARFSNAREPLRAVLQEILLEVLTPKEQKNLIATIEEKSRLREPAVIAFVGVNGTGKTTTVAKLAKYLEVKGHSVILACSDTYRTGSIEQLEEHAKRLGIKTIKHAYGADAAAVAFDTVNYAKSHGIHVVLIDTAGRMQTNKNLLDEMKKIVRVTKPDMVILVVDALTGNDAYEQGKTFMDAVGLDGVVLTKLDADAKGGSAISMSYITGKPVLYVGTGQGYKDIAPFNPQFILKALF